MSQNKYPYPHKHIPIEGGHITVDENCKPDKIEALKRLVERLRALPADKLKEIIEKNNEAK